MVVPGCEKPPQVATEEARTSSGDDSETETALVRVTLDFCTRNIGWT